jgi:Icc-related predicted phosphoesterase
MRIALVSDVHLEFGFLDIRNTENADVLILSGDICVAKTLLDQDGENMKESRSVQGMSNRFHEFFQQACSEFKNVVYVMGNHEHYDGDFATTESTIRSKLGYLKNLHFLEKESVKIDDVTFIGGTLWTDMNGDDDYTRHHVQRRMNDFQIVRNSNRMVTRTVPIYEENLLYTEDGKNGGKYVTDEKGYYKEIGKKKKQEPSTLCPEDVVPEHKAMVEYIRTVIEGKFDEKFVVVGHHAPSKLSTHPRYKHDTLMNGAYSSDLNEFILAHPQIKLWTHGHTHENFDYMLGTTRVFCNPRGYINYESKADDWTLKSVEI